MVGFRFGRAESTSTSRVSTPHIALHSDSQSATGRTGTPPRDRGAETPARISSLAVATTRTDMTARFGYPPLPPPRHAMPASHSPLLALRDALPPRSLRALPVLIAFALNAWFVPTVRAADQGAPAAGDPGAEDAPAEDDASATGEPDDEASGKESSIWDFIEPGEAASATPSVKEAAEELSAQRLSELADLGSVGAEPSVEYYLDPIAATNGDPLHLDEIDPKEFDIPVVVNDDVKRWMVYFLGRGRKYYAHYLERSTKWRPLMYKQI